MKFTLKRLCTGALMTILCTHAGAIDYTPQNAEATLMLKTPGNHSVTYPLSMKKADNGYCTYELVSGRAIPVTVYQKLTGEGDKRQVTTFITALEDIYFNYNQSVRTGFRHDDCQFYMPGFWYRRNLRSPEKAPSFHTSDSWTVRTD